MEMRTPAAGPLSQERAEVQRYGKRNSDTQYSKQAGRIAAACHERLAIRASENLQALCSLPQPGRFTG